MYSRVKLRGWPNTYSTSSPCITPIHSPHRLVLVLWNTQQLGYTRVKRARSNTLPGLSSCIRPPPPPAAPSYLPPSLCVSCQPHRSTLVSSLTRYRVAINRWPSRSLSVFISAVPLARWKRPLAGKLIPTERKKRGKKEKKKKGNLAVFWRTQFRKWAKLFFILAFDQQDYRRKAAERRTRLCYRNVSELRKKRTRISAKLTANRESRVECLSLCKIKYSENIEMVGSSRVSDNSPANGA